MSAKFGLFAPACLTVFLCLTGFPSYSKDVVMRPSELNENKITMDGREILLRGYVIHEPDAYAIWDGIKSKEQEDISRCISLLYSDGLINRIASANRHYVTVKGVFHRNVTKGRGVFGGLCNYTGVVVSEIVDIEE